MVKFTAVRAVTSEPRRLRFGKTFSREETWIPLYPSSPGEGVSGVDIVVDLLIVPLLSLITVDLRRQPRISVL